MNGIGIRYYQFPSTFIIWDFSAGFESDDEENEDDKTAKAGTIAAWTKNGINLYKSCPLAS